MPPIIQSVSGTVAAGTTIALTLPQNVNQGNAICVIIGQASASDKLTNITDSQGNTYTAFNISTSGNGSTMNIAGRVAKKITGGPTVITVTLTSVTAVAIAFEISGLGSGTTNAANQDATGSASGSTTAVTFGTATTNTNHCLQILEAMNVSGATYTLGANQANLLQVSDGTNSLGISSRFLGNAGASTGAMTISSAVSWISNQNCLFSSNLSMNNYQFVKVGDGMSASEKIR